MATVISPDRPAVDPAAPSGGHRVPTWLPGALLVAVLGSTRIGDRELWVDEAFSLAATHDLGTTLARTQATMGLYYAVLTPWAALAEDAAWIRGLSLVLMTAAVAVLATTVGRWHGRAAGLVAGLVAGCAYLPARLAVEARSYALVALLVVLSWAALDHVVSGGARGRWWWLYVGCTLALPLAHGLAAIQVIVQVAAVAAARPDRRTWWRHTAAAAASGSVVVALLTMGIEGVGDWLDPLSRSTAAALGREVLHPIPLLAVAVAGLVVAGQLVVARAHGAGSATDRFRRAALLLWGPGALALVLAISVVRPSHLGRYSLGAALGLAGLAGVALSRAPGSTRPVRLAVIALALALVLVGQRAVDVSTSRPWTDTAALVAAHARPGDGLLFTDPEVRLPFEAAWMGGDGRPALHLVEPALPLGRYERFSEVPPAARVGTLLHPGQRVWLVHEDLPHATNRRSDLMDDPSFRARVEVLSTWSPSDRVEVRLLEVR